MKSKKSVGFILFIIAGLLAVAAAVAYRSVMYTEPKTYVCLLAAVAVIVVATLLAGKFGNSVLFSIFTIAASVLIAYGITLGTGKMVNQIAYVVTGLDPFKTITTYVVFAVLAVLALVFTWLAAFVPTVKEA